MLCWPSERSWSGLLAPAPYRLGIALGEAIWEAAPLLVVEVPTSYDPPPFSLRAPARNPLWRFFAQVLIRLLIIAP